MLIQSDNLIKNPKISIAVLIYNQAPYLRECFDSILAQKTNYAFEIVISDDCSSDESQNICREYQAKYPQCFRLCFQEHNLGLIDNYKFLISSCRGEYIALFAGDDYWCDVTKIQKQIDFLESHKDFSMCFTNAYLLEDWNKNQYEWPYTNIEQRQYVGSEIIRKWTIPASSVVFRKNSIDFSFLTKERFYAEDLVTYLKLAETGNLFAFSDKMIVYRQHKGQITSLTDSGHNINWVTNLIHVDEELNYKYHKIIYTDISCYYLNLAKKTLENTRRYIRKSLKFFLQRNK